ncbi:hypothetical protein [Engelhardtia mirabilis]|uniref:Uncharacterized protein n=1 Tax=Engelhardtia mirabilis TaxID=2528011 RepID=A0A518BL39_9BACT|nr:hypothetical protein Pla133_27740 [Planctomycetes bacterium Pla133]QDV02012.1 hypothetical protein Pla86_27730 [Planctomycetes bacterium Pla86]
MTETALLEALACRLGLILGRFPCKRNGREHFDGFIAEKFADWLVTKFEEEAPVRSLEDLDG